VMATDPSLSKPKNAWKDYAAFLAALLAVL
jgi:hypothetical protein